MRFICRQLALRYAKGKRWSLLAGVCAFYGATQLFTHFEWLQLLGGGMIVRASKESPGSRINSFEQEWLRLGQRVWIALNATEVK